MPLLVWIQWFDNQYVGRGSFMIYVCFLLNLFIKPLSGYIASMTVSITDHPSVKGYLLLKSTSIFKPFMTLKYYVNQTTISNKNIFLWNYHESWLIEVVLTMKCKKHKNLILYVEYKRKIRNVIYASFN